MGSKEQMIAILRSSETARISFSYSAGGIGGMDTGRTHKIDGNAFLTVASKISEGYLKIVEDEFPGEDRMVYAASDDPVEAYEANTFYLGGTSRQSRQFGALVVHEAVHAHFDLEHVRIPWVDNEAAAYIAQAYYLRNSGYSAARIPKGSPVALGLQAIGKMRSKVDASTLIEDIRDSLRGNPNYHTQMGDNFFGDG